MLARVEVDIHGRWDAVALSESLVAYRSHLVEFTGERWRVYAATPGYHDEQLSDAVSAIEGCLRERCVEDAVVRIEWRPSRRQLDPGARRGSTAAP